MQKKGLIAGYGTGEISLKKMVFYNLLFFIPIAALIFFSLFIAKYLIPVLQTSRSVTAQILMIFFSLILFAIIIPIIRKRESVEGVRYALIGFLIVAVGLTLPSIILEWDFSPLYIQFPHLATYILLTFIYCPEVLGMDIDISKWFQHFKQILIIIVYCSIVIFYVAGFGWIFFSMANANPGAFSHTMGMGNAVEYPTYIYFSVVSFTTIGYGEILPVSTGARFLVSVEAIVGSIVNVIFIAILFVYVSNFQSFIKGVKEEEAKIEKEERMIIKEEKAILKKINKAKQKKPKR